MLEILTYPDERLRQKAKPVEKVDDSIKKIIDDMFETMYASAGIGLAAVQVNIDLQIVVVDLSTTKDQPLVLINPNIIAASGEIICEEGCLSVPEIREKVKRADRIVVDALNREGESIRIEAEEFFAVCLQHEIDHLNGVLFVDHLSRLKQGRVKTKLRKFSNQG